MTRGLGVGAADWPHGPVLKLGLLGSCAGLAVLLQGGPASADEIEDARAKLLLLKERLAALEARQDTVESVGVAAPAAAVQAGDKPRSWKLPGTNTSIAVGGYAKLDLLFDLGPFAGDSLVPQDIPFANSTADLRKGTFRAHARQSRLWFKSWTPTDWGELATHIEGDFFGTGGNEIVSNSTSFRLRHAYGRLGPVLAGQWWTNFQDVDSEMNTLDFYGQEGTIFIRQAQIRYSHVFRGGSTTLDVALENPETTGQPQSVVGRAGPGLGPSGIAVDRMPDFTGQLRYTHSKGHVALRGLLRYAAVDSGGGGNSAVPSTLAVADNAVGWGAGISGVFSITDKDTVGGQFNYGDGIGRYLQGVGIRGGFACSAGCDSNASGLAAQTTFGGAGWYGRQWTETIETNVGAGYSFVSLKTNVIGAAGVAGVPRSSWNANGNIIWSPVPAVNFGLEVIYARTVFKANGQNDALRFMTSFQFNF